MSSRSTSPFTKALAGCWGLYLPAYKSYRFLGIPPCSSCYLLISSSFDASSIFTSQAFSNSLTHVSCVRLYDVSFMCHIVGCNGISVHVFKAALLQLGFEVGTSHTNPQGIKSNAPPSVS
jgi:hypothetical protein